MTDNHDAAKRRTRSLFGHVFTLMQFGNSQVTDDVALLQKLIAKGVDINQQAVQSPLLIAAVYQNAEFVGILRQAGATIGVSEAAVLGETNILHRYLDDSIDANVGQSMFSILGLAVRSGNAEIVKLLLDRGVALSPIGKLKKPLLIIATMLGYREIVRLLCDAGTPIGFVELGMLGDVTQLEQALNAGAEIDQVSPYEMTTLVAAAASGHTECVRFLLTRGAKDVQMALLQAIENQHIQTVEMLIDFGVDINCADACGMLPLRAATRSSELTRLLLDRGADVNLQTASGATALHATGWTITTDVTEMLVDAGVDLNTLDQHGRTPLHSMAYTGRLNSVRFLLERGADATVRDYEGNTPLHIHGWGWRNGDEIARLLIEAGADANAQNHKGETPLKVPLNHHIDDLVSILLSYGADMALVA